MCPEIRLQIISFRGIVLLKQNTRLFTDIVSEEPPDGSIWSRIRCMGLFVAERLCCRVRSVAARNSLIDMPGIILCAPICLTSLDRVAKPLPQKMALLVLIHPCHSVCYNGKVVNCWFCGGCRQILIENVRG
jgi:hypothetical protein